MTLQVVKTKAEQALVEQFAGVEAALPGGKSVQKLRRVAIGVFVGMGLPHRRIEEWKYTDLRNMLKEAAKPAPQAPLRIKAADINAALGTLAGHDAHRITFVDGRYERTLSNVKVLGGGLHFKPLSEMLGEESGWLVDLIEADVGRTALLALNTAYMTDGATLRVDDGQALDKPIVLVFARTTADPHATTTRNFIKFGIASSGVVVEVHIALAGAAQVGQANTVTSISIDDKANVTHVKLVCERDAGVHLSTLLAGVGADANYRPFQMTAGAGLVRNDIEIKYKGEGAKLDLSGVFLGRRTNHIDTTLVVDHAVPRCVSRELFKCVLDDTARGIFQGKVVVRPHAQKTDGKQMAQALMLSPDAEFDSKPELEIYADDVVCGHGSTAAEIDEDLLFYCRSRGIALKDARAMLIDSFIGEAIDKVEHVGVREALRAKATEWLRAPKV